ncbi:hypothetical protein [Arthrobacter sp. AQ5-05]|uniref:hypothetical protein n=1 Tax=Arthrobacter sp. AQ5-05 TaxID=2184581 RepID=UPI0015EBBD9C|nr:hypothetical protein [Arthrobacter sp. AQ5-05]
MNLNEQAIEAAACANYIATYPADRTPETWALLKGPWRKSYIDNARAAVTAYLSALTVSTTKGLRNLPVGSVTVDDVGIVRKLDGKDHNDNGTWIQFAHENPERDQDLALPARVLHLGGTA